MVWCDSVMKTKAARPLGPHTICTHKLQWSCFLLRLCFRGHIGMWPWPSKYPSPFSSFWQSVRRRRVGRPMLPWQEGQGIGLVVHITDFFVRSSKSDKYFQYKTARTLTGLYIYLNPCKEIESMQKTVRFFALGTCFQQIDVLQTHLSKFHEF